jgi:acetyl esterase/lipase
MAAKAPVLDPVNELAPAGLYCRILVGGRMTARFPSILFAGLASTAALFAADPAVTTSYDVPSTSVGGSELRLDIVQPVIGGGPFPAVLVIHGGAWREGGREETHRYLADLARRGYVAVSPQYRFCPRDTFPLSSRT